MDDRQVLRTWWREGDRYLPLMETIASHCAVAWLKVMVGAIAMCVSVVALSISLFDHTTGIVGHVGTAVGAVVAAGWALRWWAWPMPGKAEAVAMFAAVDVLAVLICIGTGGVFVTWAGAILMFVIGLCFGFFHTAKILAAHIAWSVAFSMVMTVTLLRDGKPLAVSLSFLLLVVVAQCVLLPGLHFGCGLLWTDLLSDPLTRLWDRRGFRLHGRVVVERGGRLPVCVMVIDLDRFKRINDTFGHHVGDDVLVRTAQRLRGTVPANAIVARTGGEEFAVLARLPTVDAYAVAERLRCAIAETTETVPVTASIGIATLDIDQARCHNSDRIVMALARRADTAMYRAKLHGGNTVELGAVVSPGISRTISPR